VRRSLALLLLAACTPTGAPPPAASASAPVVEESDLPPVAPRPVPSVGLAGAERVSPEAASDLVSDGDFVAHVELVIDKHALVLRDADKEIGRAPLDPSLRPLALSVHAERSDVFATVLVAGEGKLAVFAFPGGKRVAEAAGAARAAAPGKDRGWVLAVDGGLEIRDAALAPKGTTPGSDVVAASADAFVRAPTNAKDAIALELLPAAGGKPIASAIAPGPALAARVSGKRALWVSAPGSLFLDQKPRPLKLQLASGVAAIAPDLSRIATFDGERLRVWDVRKDPPKEIFSARGIEALEGVGSPGRASTPPVRAGCSASASRWSRVHS